MGFFNHIHVSVNRTGINSNFYSFKSGKNFSHMLKHMTKITSKLCELYLCCFLPISSILQIV